jgi:hypothetical protein
VVNVTGMPLSALPPASVTFALIVRVPPPPTRRVDGIRARRQTALTAADPTAILTAFAAATLAPPEGRGDRRDADEVPAKKARGRATVDIGLHFSRLDTCQGSSKR